MLRSLLLLFALGSSLSAFASQPNVIVILADDLGWSDTSLYGTTTYYQTPNVERLAKRGMTFTRAYSASPLCSPTRSALLTGQSPARTGITVPNCHEPRVVLQATTGKKAPPDQKAIMPDPVTRLKTEYRTLAETLKDAGYATAHFGKWHLGPEPYSPLQQGFDVDLPHHPGPGPAGSFVAPWKFANFKEKSPGEHIEDRMAAEAVAWMEQTKDKPFYMNYWMFSVHAPFDAKKANIEKHRGRVDPKDAQRSPTYAAMIQSMDDAIGTLLDGLDRLKLADNTIIVFTADNGGNMYNEVDGTTPTSNRPLRGGKATMFEGGTRVPCVVVWPGIATPGSRSDALVQSEDFYPTLMEGLHSSHLAPRDEQGAASAEKASGSSKISPSSGSAQLVSRSETATFDGSSIVPALKGDALAGKAVFQYFPHNPGVPDWLPPSVSVHRDDWKLIRIFHGGEKGAHRHLLFNLREDLSEKNNLAAQKPELVAELDALIEGFLTDTKAVVPVPNPAFDPSKYRPELEGKQQPKGKAKAPAKGKDDAIPALQGWKARDCQAAVKEGILRLTSIGSECFLGFSASKHSGPTTAKFRIKAQAGRSHFDWLPGGVGSKPQRSDFTLKGGDWEEIRVELPAEGPLGIVRLYLPMQEQAVEIDWIELISKNGSKPTRTAF
ncbi:sulfatase [Prosthecobacter sp.]|jgi:arylsulfatase A-like enzyme|uniref:sulfatase n=1 Tax=Prosthecobacter sp. TaxID=1965333 RepID=UPI003783C47F